MSTLLSAVRRLPRDVRTPASIHVISIPKTVAILSALISGSATGTGHIACYVALIIVIVRYRLIWEITAATCEEDSAVDK